MSTILYSQEDDDEISLQSFDSSRSGESHEYARNASGYNSPVNVKKSVVLPVIPDAVKQIKKRRIRPTCLQEKLPVDIITNVGPCITCSMVCQTKFVDGGFHLCLLCSKHAVGVAFKHPKLKIIIQLRREIDLMELQMTRLGSESNMPMVVDLHSRISATHRVIAGLIYDTTDIRTL